MLAPRKRISPASARVFHRAHAFAVVEHFRRLGAEVDLHQVDHVAAQQVAAAADRAADRVVGVVVIRVGLVAMLAALAGEHVFAASRAGELADAFFAAVVRAGGVDEVDAQV
jgi:hypothetical protein